MAASCPTEKNINRMSKFIKGDVRQEMQDFYSSEELSELATLSDTPRDVETRMPVKITRHYFELAKNSPSLQTLIKASPEETLDLVGAPDPGKQMDYGPIEGLIRKYELGLIYSDCRTPRQQ